MHPTLFRLICSLFLKFLLPLQSAKSSLMLDRFLNLICSSRNQHIYIANLLHRVFALNQVVYSDALESPVTEPDINSAIVQFFRHLKQFSRWQNISDSYYLALRLYFAKRVPWFFLQDLDPLWSFGVELVLAQVQEQGDPLGQIDFVKFFHFQFVLVLVAFFLHVIGKFLKRVNVVEGS